MTAFSKRPPIAGTPDQNGACLARDPLERGYHVSRIYRRTHSSIFWRLQQVRVADHRVGDLLAFDLANLVNDESRLRRIATTLSVPSPAEAFGSMPAEDQR